VLGIDAQLPLVVLVDHLSLFVSDDGQLCKLLFGLLGNLFVDALCVDVAFYLGIGALLLHREVVFRLDLIDLALDLHLVEF
jgi:hypothetical protein